MPVDVPDWTTQIIRPQGAPVACPGSGGGGTVTTVSIPNGCQALLLYLTGGTLSLYTGLSVVGVQGGQTYLQVGTPQQFFYVVPMVSAFDTQVNVTVVNAAGGAVQAVSVFQSAVEFLQFFPAGQALVNLASATQNLPFQTAGVFVFPYIRRLALFCSVTAVTGAPASFNPNVDLLAPDGVWYNVGTLALTGPGAFAIGTTMQGGVPDAVPLSQVRFRLSVSGGTNPTATFSAFLLGRS